mmetsp:Transcript_93131/g.290334  ORF Transcript_93131/g.290334 Transcript_93131/m.290334 type:complete len:274 (-) Transcript_93131:64-885(-)
MFIGPDRPTPTSRHGRRACNVPSVEDAVLTVWHARQCPGKPDASLFECVLQQSVGRQAGTAFLAPELQGARHRERLPARAGGPASHGGLVVDVALQVGEDHCHNLLSGASSPAACPTAVEDALRVNFVLLPVDNPRGERERLCAAIREQIEPVGAAPTAREEALGECGDELHGWLVQQTCLRDGLHILQYAGPAHQMEEEDAKLRARSNTDLALKVKHRVRKIQLNVGNMSACQGEDAHAQRVWREVGGGARREPEAGLVHGLGHQPGAPEPA